MAKGFDVSENNGYVDFEQAANEGYEFVIVRSSYGKSGKDENFLDNVNRAHAAGLKVGAYHYSYALTPDDALQEAQNCREVIDDAGVLLELPVFFDMEDADGYKARHGFDFSAGNITEICRVFLENIGLNCGVYASESWLDNYIDWQGLGCSVWNASWYSEQTEPNPDDNVDGIKGYMWQYTDKAYIAGKYLDADWIYGEV